jgi:galactokinase
VTGRWQWFVPGRLEVFGKHTDYAGGRSLVAAVPRGIAIAAVASDDGLVVVEDAMAGQRATFRSDGSGDVDGWRRYVATVIRRLLRNFPGANLSARIEISSTLPRAAGISSSSALVIAIAEALIARAEIEASPLWQKTIPTLEARAAYFGCIENGASYGPFEGDGGVGTHGGSEDHAAILTSRAGWLQQFAFTPLRLEHAVAMPEAWTFVVASTGVRAPKTGSARAAYNRASDAMVRVAQAWRNQHPDDLRPIGQLVRAGEPVTALALPDDLRVRLEHFIAEDARVPLALDAFARGDVAEVGRLAHASQRDAERLLGNQVPQTGEMVSLARDCGAAAASGFGAGWGGSVWALVETVHAPTFLDRWLRAYRARYPFLTSEGFVAPPSDGLRRV